MDGSNLPSVIAFAVSILIYIFVCLVEAFWSANRPLRGSGRTLLAVPGFLPAMKIASVMACSISGLTVARSSDSLVAWWVISSLGMGLLLVLLLLQGISFSIGYRYTKIIVTFSYRVLRNIILFGGAKDDRAGGQRVNQANNETMSSESMMPPNDPVLVITEEEQSSLDARERLMIRSILRLDESTTREVMVPRVDIVALEVDTLLKEVAEKLVDSGHSRLPIYDETIDKIIGVVHALDVLPLLSDDTGYTPLTNILRPAFFIPESKRLDELLQEFQEKHIQMAIVVDEYGGTEGLVTIEDLLEEIVGEIDDEFSRQIEPQAMPLANGGLVVDARITLSYLSDFFSMPIEMPDVDTVGGLVYSYLGKIPTTGDEVMYEDLRIEVISLIGRRIKKLKVSRLSIS